MPPYNHQCRWLGFHHTYCINILQAKVKARLAFLFRKKASFTHATKHTLVKITLLIILDYGDIIYKMASSSALKKLTLSLGPTLYH